MELRLIALALLLAGCGGLGIWFSHHERAIGDARTEAKYAARDAAAAAAALAETQRQANASAEAANEAQRLNNRARDAAVAAGVSAQRLHDYSASLARACAPVAAASGSASTASAGDMQTRLLDWTTARAIELAAYADAARIAGDACVSASR